MERMSDFRTAIQRLRLWAHWRVWLLVQRQTPLEILVDASSRARVWADGGGFVLLGNGAFALGDSVNGQALLERGFAGAWRWLVGVCTFRTSSLFRVLPVPCAVFLGAGAAYAKLSEVFLTFARVLFTLGLLTSVLFVFATFLLTLLKFDWGWSTARLLNLGRFFGFGFRFSILGLLGLLGGQCNGALEVNSFGIR